MTGIICIVCPKGCRLNVDEENGFRVTGNNCERGAEYGRAELENPTRVLTSTVKITGAAHNRCPVKTGGAIPKPMIFEAMKLLDAVELKAPVKRGQIVIKDICGTKIPFVVTRDL